MSDNSIRYRVVARIRHFIVSESGIYSWNWYFQRTNNIHPALIKYIFSTSIGMILSYSSAIQFKKDIDVDVNILIIQMIENMASSSLLFRIFCLPFLLMMSFRVVMGQKSWILSVMFELSKLYKFFKLKIRKINVKKINIEK